MATRTDQLSKNGKLELQFPQQLQLSNAALPYCEVLYPIGYPVAIHTNSREVLAAAREVWRCYKQVYNRSAIEVRITVNEGESPRQARDPLLHGHLMALVHGPGDFAVCDIREGVAIATVTNWTAARPSYLRYHFLEPAVYVLLSGRGVPPIHAACVALDGTGVLLCGDSEAGKSTLAYACARAGWSYVSDDAIHLAGPSASWVAGRPYQIRFRPHTAKLFPELARFPIEERPNGKPNIEIDSECLGIATADRVRARHVIFLNRVSPGAALITPYDKQIAFERMAKALCIGDEPIRKRQRRRLQNLLDRAEIHEMRYGDLGQAEKCLRGLLQGERE